GGQGHFSRSSVGAGFKPAPLRFAPARRPLEAQKTDEAQGEGAQPWAFIDIHGHLPTFSGHRRTSRRKLRGAPGLRKVRIRARSAGAASPDVGGRSTASKILQNPSIS